jgi:hypothetical protein
VDRTVAQLACIALLVTACAGEPSPEQQVRAVIAAGEEAAEKRDAGELLELVSESYSDAEGRNAAELGRYVRGYLLAHPSLHLVTRIDSIEFPFRDQAHVRMTIGSLAREGPAATLDLAADLQDIELELTREGDEWRVTRAERVR